MRSTLRRAPRTHFSLGLLAAGLGLAAAGCGTADLDEPGVFFVYPTDGATVTSPIEVVMGSRNIEIGAVPPEVVTARPNIVHYHLGTNTDCLPPGTVIPQADPWIHFGDGSNEIEMNFPPGEYRLAIQAGDDEHRTIAGLCQVISITVVEDGED